MLRRDEDPGDKDSWEGRGCSGGMRTLKEGTRTFGKGKVAWEGRGRLRGPRMVRVGQGC